MVLKVTVLNIDLSNLKIIYSFLVRPIITVSEPKINVRPTEDVSLECVFEFYPRGLIWWERESGIFLYTVFEIYSANF